MIHFSDINEICIILHMEISNSIRTSRAHSNCEVKAVNKSELRVLQTFFNMPLQAQGRSAFFAMIGIPTVHCYLQTALGVAEIELQKLKKFSSS